MSKSEKKVCLLTSLSISSLAKPAPQRTPRPRGAGAKARSRFAYWLPLVGEVCRAAFLAAFGVSHCSLTRLRRQLAQDQRLVPAPHGNARNANAKKLDDALLSSWLREVAEREGEAVTTRARVRRGEGAQRKRAVVERRHIQLPVRCTWELLLQEFKAYAEQEAPQTHVPSLASFRRILSDKCPDIRVGGIATTPSKPKPAV